MPSFANSNPRFSELLSALVIMSSDKSYFIFHSEYRKILVFLDQCPQYSVAHPCLPSAV